MSLDDLQCAFLSATSYVNLELFCRADSTKGSYAKEWAKWEKQLRETLFGNAEYLNAIQVHFTSL